MVIITSSTSSASSSNHTSPTWKNGSYDYEWSFAPKAKFEYSNISNKSAKNIPISRQDSISIPISVQNGTKNGDFLPKSGQFLPKSLNLESPRLKVLDAFNSVTSRNGVKQRLYDKRTDSGRALESSRRNSIREGRRRTSQSAIEQRRLEANRRSLPLVEDSGIGDKSPNLREKSLRWKDNCQKFESGEKFGQREVVVFRKPNGESIFPADPFGTLKRHSYDMNVRDYRDSDRRGSEYRRRSSREAIRRQNSGEGKAQPCPQNAYSYQTSPSNRTTRKSMSGVQNNPKPAVMSNTGVAVTQEVNGHHHTFSVNPSDSKSSTQPHQILVQPSQSAAVVHQRQHSHNKNSVKSTEFPVLINGSQSNGSIKQQQNGIALNGTNSSTNSSRMSMPAAPTLDRGQKELKKKHSETTQVPQNVANPVQALPQAPKVVISSAKVAIDSRPNPNNDVAKATHEPRRSKSEKSGSKMKVENFSALTNFGQESGIPNASHSNVVMVRLTPEAQRKCEISISGGSDFSHPAIISRMVFSTSNGNVPMSCPLNEGDQVLKINGCDIGQWPQAKVQTFLSELKTSNVDIILAIKPNVYRCGDLNEDDDSSRPFNNSSPAETARSSHIRQKSADPSSNIDLGIKAACGLPESQHVPEAVPRSDKLAQSLLLLKEALASGRVAQQFDQLYRKKPGLTMNDSKLPQNIQKNRYRDVCPYDSTRVRLVTAPSGDYINACHVNMEIPTSGIVNRYIATQGPLPHTSGDFWHMVWEQSATAIVMLTTIMEKGRVKCHQYWPEVGESMDLGSYLQVKNVSEKVEAHCHYRELVVKNLLTGEERNVTQMQYRSWPDHGVPDNPQHFIDFVSEVRKARNGSLDPIIVHCSAGIGRTGVLILMETAACQIEANEPVYPLDILKVMRDQRAMLIQTAEQYVFVCNSIIKAYQDQSVKPLEEYQKKTGTCKV
ncbi:protein-tyrosine phosphatase domain-containing protein [Ditylenchus destructor]|nr:protein-tyrosine phosphatase domain-containing protein [Ditylenchus destructor]